MSPRAALILLAALVLEGPAHAYGSAATTSIAADRARIDQVAYRLETVIPMPARYEWPPRVAVDGDERPAAYTDAVGRAGRRLKVRIVVTRGLIERAAEGRADRLAFVVGHEMAHLVLGHAAAPPPGRTAGVRAVFSREQEEAADRKAMEWLLIAGYSYREALRLPRRMLDPSLESETDGLDGMRLGHPSWRERLALLDKEQRPLWRAMSAFQTGAFMLSVEQYEPAADCFRRVIREFPACPEAWADLGDALLKEYCDSLAPSDLAALGVGRLALGAFYERPHSLEAAARGQREELWKQAVEALEAALGRDPTLAIAEADLGVAHLAGPLPRDLKAARRSLDAAAARVETRSSLAPAVRAAILVNAAAADELAGREADAERRRARAARIAPGSPEIAAAVRGQRVLQAAGRRRFDPAVGAGLIGYLKAEDPYCAWWKAGYAYYLDGCAASHTRPAAVAALRGRAPKYGYRLLAGVKLGPATVSLGEPMSAVERRLGPGRAVPVIPGYDLRRVRYPRYGAEILATDRVLAIRLSGSRAPVLPVRRKGLGGGGCRLVAGMTIAGLQRALHEEPSAPSEWIEPGIAYRFYRRIGLAVRTRGRRVDELIVTQLPVADARAVSLR